MRVPNEVLQTILATGKVPHPDGSVLDLTSATSAEECECMYSQVCSQKPDLVVEIGMAYGVSALTILTALEHNGHGSLVSVDPYPGWESARLAALHNIRQAGLSGRHRHIHAPSEIALPQLVQAGTRVDFVYIDGHHGFDHVFVDWFYSDALIKVNGIIAFDDSGWRSVHKVIAYLLRHRDYQEIDVGIEQHYRGRNALASLLRRVQGRRGPSRYFRKATEWVAPYSFYRPF